jgi:DNA/RNA endonuclease G (NUC1)/PKD repeat protein
VSWNLNGSQFGDAPRCDCFSADLTLPSDFYHVVDFDYRNGGYDRGHMVQSESRTTTDFENASTFLLTNILPQAAENNQGPWSKFENYLNDLARGNTPEGKKEIYVIAGGEYAATPGTLKNEGKVAIPDYTWKIAVILPEGQGLADVVAGGGMRVIAVRMPNLVTASGPTSAIGIRNNPWDTYTTTVDAIEAATGYDFLSALPDNIENVVESNDHPPVAAISGPYAIGEGSSLTLDASASKDEDGDAMTYAWDFGDGTRASGPNSAVTHFFPDNGVYAVVVTVTDKYGAQSSAATEVTASNLPPTASFAASGPVVEGSSFPLSLSGASDPSPVDAADLRYAFDCGTGSFGAESARPTTSCATTDNGLRTVRARVSDKDGGASEYTSTVRVDNAPPVITGFVVPTGAQAVGTPVAVRVSFTDVGIGDTHETLVDWGDGSSSPVLTGEGELVATHEYTRAGLYTITAAVRDDDGGSAMRTSTSYLVVFDPAAGFVTGGGWIDSPARAFAGDASVRGKATFVMDVKYLPGSETPAGDVSFRMQAGGLDFTSGELSWLVVTNGRAMVSGSGTVAGRAGTVSFIATAIEGPLSGGRDDRMRLKVWDADGTVLYDNGFGAADASAASTMLGGGNITVHTR